MTPKSHLTANLFRKIELDMWFRWQPQTPHAPLNPNDACLQLCRLPSGCSKSTETSKHIRSYLW